MHIHYILTIFLTLGFIIPAFSQSDKQAQEVENLAVFAKLYGQVKYFYPGDEASDMDWNKFAIAGVEVIRQLDTNKAELLPTLKDFFLPIAPGIMIGKANEIDGFDLSSITPKDHKKLKPVYWQHRGVGNGNPKNVYQSIRINRKKEPIQGRDGSMLEFPEKLFDTELAVGEHIEANLGQGLKAIIPLALYADKEHTYPQVKQEALIKLSEKINQLAIPYNQGNQLPVRLANIIITWNTFQHFYPYFDLLDLDWENELTQTLSDTYADESFIDFKIRLEKLTAKLKDGHIQVRAFGDDSESGTPRFTWEWIEEQLVITQILDSNYQDVKIGETIIEVNHQKPEAFFDERLTRISSSTKGWGNYQAHFLTLRGEYMGSFPVKVKGSDGNVREIEVKRDMRLKDFYQRLNDLNPTHELKPGIWYLNLDRSSWAEIDSLLPKLTEAKAIICDLRGYPAGNHQLISHLLTKKDTSAEWMQIPLVTRPNFQQVEWQEMGWSMKPQKPHLSAPVYFLTDGRAISYAESYMSFIKHYQLATIIGQPTAGTNGNVNYLVLPGKYRITFTGMRVRKHDRSELSGSGIQPDIFVERTIDALIQGRDEYLEKALSEIEKQ